jgi:quercetin dioxygenase-like cupin family protein
MNTITIDDITRPAGWAPIRRELGVTAFGVNAWTKPEGEQLVAEHTEERSGQDELYVLLEGRALFAVDGEEREVAAGSVVHVPAAARRSATALADGTRILVVGRTADDGYREPAFETNAEVIALFADDRVEDARALLEAADSRIADRGTFAYNLACCEARLGNPEAALAHLSRAFEERENLAELAADDEDLAALRGDERFEALVQRPATAG